MTSSPGQKKSDSDLLRIALAGVAAMTAATCTHPIEVVKTRKQIVGEAGRTTKQYGNTLDVARKVLSEEGAAGLYKGIQAAWLRESVYSSLRLGLYEPFKRLLGATDPKNTPFWLKFVAASSSGLLGSFLANPFDLLKIRMQAQETKSMGLSWHVNEVYSKQGFFGFYRGVQATVTRAMILNGVKLAVYDHIKHTIIGSGLLKDGKLTQFLSSVVAGVCMAIATAPFDLARTRLMNQPTDQKLYNGMVDCFVKIVRNEGPLALYKGFTPQWMRFGPTTTIQLVTWEALRRGFGMSGV